MSATSRRELVEEVGGVFPVTGDVAVQKKTWRACACLGWGEGEGGMRVCVRVCVFLLFVLVLLLLLLVRSDLADDVFFFY